MTLHVDPSVLEYQHAEAIHAKLLEALQPDPDLSLSEWADAYRYLPAEGANEPGMFATSRTPYVREWQDNLSARSPVVRTILMKGSQIGGTEIGINWSLYIADVNPAPTLIVLPTIQAAKDVSERIEASIEADPKKRLRAKIPEAKRGRAGKGSNTKLGKRFPAGWIKLVGANSATALASNPFRNACLDETDRYPVTVGGSKKGEGDVRGLVDRRQSTFGARAKTLVISTPVIDQTSIIKQEFLKGDQRRYFMPCPCCKGLIDFRWKQLDIKPTAESPRYTCQACGDSFTEVAKVEMLPAGRWIPAVLAADDEAMAAFAADDWTRLDDWNRSPESFVRSYHLSSLYSPLGWLSWKRIVATWHEAQGKPSELQTFINTILGETWVERGEAPSDSVLYADHRGIHGRGEIPLDVVILTAGVDVGQDHVEVHIWGWGPRGRRWLIDWYRADGEPQQEATWRQIQDVIDRRWKHPLGGDIGIAKVFIDQNFRPEVAWPFIKKQPGHRVDGIMGNKETQSESVVWSSKKIPLPGGQHINVGKMALINSGMLKSEWYTHLEFKRAEDGSEPHGFVSIPHNVTDDWCKQATSEQVRLKVDRRGIRKREWHRLEGRRAEALDCLVYARAAAIVLGVDRWSEDEWMRRYDEFREAGRAEAAQKAAAEHVQTGSFKPAPRAGFASSKPSQQAPAKPAFPLPDYGGFKLG